MPTYEDFNEKVEQRRKAAMREVRTRTYKTLIKILLPVLLALGFIIGLMMIGFINEIFAVILGAIVLITGSFNLGLVWRFLRFV